ALAKNWRYVPTTKAGVLVGQLSSATKPAEVERLAVLSAEDSQRLRDLNEALKSDPKQKTKETRASSARLRAFAGNVTAMARELSPERCLALRQAIEDAAATEAAAKAFATGTFDVGYLPATGGDLWRSLFEAARLYSSSEAYTDQEFPVTHDGAKCVLC